MVLKNRTREGEPILSEGDAHDLLRNDRRRAVIEHLRGTLGEVSLRALSETIAEEETGKSPPPRNIRESVYNSLHQTHLPKLDDCGVVSYDQNRKTVSLKRDVKDVDPFMNLFLLERYRLTWAEYYRSLAVLSLMVVLAAELGVPPFGAIDEVLWSSALLLGLALSTLYQYWGHRWTILERLVEWS